MDWPRVVRSTAVLAAVLATASYAAVLLIDPYDTVWFSPPLERAATASNQRFSYPALARSERFDSAVFGTSTTRLLQPAQLDGAIGGRFANLSMNSGTAWEQSQLFEVFARHHPNARTVVFGIDSVWCDVGDTYARLTPRPFPAWMYDRDRWNDLAYLFNLAALEETGRQLAWLTSLRPAKYGRDGYADFLPANAQYDLTRARRNIYGAAEPAERKPAVAGNAEVDSPTDWRFPTHALMAEMLGRLPAATRKVLIFVPYHVHLQPPAGTAAAAQWAACKRRMVALAAGVENAHVIDFMIESDITRRDENYWDGLHYRVEIAERLSALIARAIRERRGATDLYAYLVE